MPVIDACEELPTSGGPDHAEQMEALRRVLFWFWHELSHSIAAVGRGQL
jgi:hypothetical protein